MKKGDIVYVTDERRFYEAEITSIGSKYITVDGSLKFDKESLNGEFGWKLYKSKEDYEQSKELEIKNRQLFQKIQRFTLSLTQIEAIELIINDSNK